MDFSKLTKVWHSFRNEVNSMKTICNIPIQMKNDYEKIDLFIDCFEKSELTNPEIDDDLY